MGASYQGLAFGNVACPDGVARKSGTRFTCTVQLPGTFLVFDATQTDGRGTVTFEIAQAVMTRSAVEQFVAGNASLAATVTCGTAVFLVAATGQTSSPVKRALPTARSAPCSSPCATPRGTSPSPA